MSPHLCPNVLKNPQTLLTRSAQMMTSALGIPKGDFVSKFKPIWRRVSGWRPGTTNRSTIVGGVDTWSAAPWKTKRHPQTRLQCVRLKYTDATWSEHLNSKLNHADSLFGVFDLALLTGVTTSFLLGKMNALMEFWRPDLSCLMISKSCGLLLFTA